MLVINVYAFNNRIAHGQFVLRRVELPVFIPLDLLVESIYALKFTLKDWLNKHKFYRIINKLHFSQVMDMFSSLKSQEDWVHSGLRVA